MALTVTDLSKLDADSVITALQTINELVSENNPTLELKSGAFRDLVLYYSAILATANQENIDLILQSNSLASVIADPTLADDTILDNLASNYFVTRNAGTKAAGSVAIVLSANTDTLVSLGAIFTGPNGQIYTTEATYTGRTDSGDVITSTDVLITTRSDGKFVFAVPVIASDVGMLYNISKFSQIVLSDPPTNYFSAYAASDITGGTDVETNTQLASRLQTGIAVKSISNRASIEAALRSNEDLVNMPGISVIGYGDEEQQRYHTLFPVAHGGRVDVYTRTSPLPEHITFTKTATYQSSVGSNTIWQFSITRDDAPGFYEVKKILQTTQPETLAGYSVLTDTRGFDVTVDEVTAGTTYIPDVTSATEAAYSRYSTAVITFTDTDTLPSGLTPSVSTKNYSVTMTYQSHIDTAQDVVSDRSVSSPAGDCLIKAPVPCFVDVGISIHQETGDVTLDTGAIQTAASNAINNIGFTGRLPISVISSAVQAELLAQQALLSSVTSITLSGRIREPNGTTVNISSSSVLTFTDDPDNMTTTKTVAFLADPNNITVSVT